MATDVLRISVTEGSGHVCPGNLNRPPLPSGDRIPNERYLEKVERRPDRIPDVRYPGGMSVNFRPGGMGDATCRKWPSACPSERESCGTF